jgi:glycosyltransferase involved in cell wall biosynthesis
MDNFISTIIPTKRNYVALRQTIENLLRASSSANLEILVINEGGIREVSNYCQELKEQGFAIQEIINSKVVGSYAARNQGIKKAKGEWLLFADDGLKIPSNWREAFCQNLYEADFICCNIQVLKKPKESLAEKYHRTKGFQAKQKFEQQRFGLTTFLLVKRDVFNKMGVFHERLYSGGDLEFSQRVSNSEFRQIFLKDLVVYHEPKSWRSQFFTITRIIKGCNDLAYYYPKRYAHLKLRPKALLRTLKYLVRDLIFFNKTKLYQSGEVNFFQHELAQVIYYTLHLSAQVLVLMWPKKPFNW